MRHLITGTIVCALLGVSSAVQAQTADPQVMAPINTFMDSFNKGDSAGGRRHTCCGRRPRDHGRSACLMCGTAPRH